MRQFEPVDEGPDFTFSRVLKPLEKHRGDLTVFSGTFLEYGGGHTGDYTFLTGVQAHKAGSIKNEISAHVCSDPRSPLRYDRKIFTPFGFTVTMPGSSSNVKLPEFWRPAIDEVNHKIQQSLFARWHRGVDIGM